MELLIMARLSNKHGEAAQRIFYPAFDGGLNLAVPSESMAKNELKEALNVEFSHATGAMTVRGGLVWSGRFATRIESVVPVQGRRGFLVKPVGTRDLYYFRWNNIWPVQGLLTGGGKLSIAAWDNDFLVASGGKLQRFSDSGALPSIETLENSPKNCRQVFILNGRVGVVSGDDTLTFSWVGDCTKWDNDPDDESTGQFVEIGYKDGMNIKAVVPLSKDLIVFKSPENEPDKGIIWRLTGEFPEWAVLAVAHNTGTFNTLSTQSIGNDVFYITVSGVASLSSVTEYGEIKTAWPDRKVSTALTPLIDNTAQLWDIPVKQQLWVIPTSSSKEIWVLDYTRGIWTKFLFPEVLVYAVGIDNTLFAFIGKDLYEIKDGYIQDEIKDYMSGKMSKKNISAKMVLGTLLSGHQTLIKGAYASFSIMPSCSAELVLGKFRMPFSSGKTEDYIYDPPNDTQYASEDDDPLFSEGGAMTARRRCIVRDWAITPEIVINGGGCSVSTLGLEIVEV